MELKGAVEIAAPAPDVWAFILDPARLSSCVPGVGAVRQVDERTFEGTVSASVGPMHGDFTFTSVIRRSDFPADLVVEIGGTDSVTRSAVDIVVAAALEPDGPARTGLQYSMTVNVKGRLAILGEMILRATAGAMVGQVSACLRDRLEAAAVATTAAEG
jgi:carbon monoxide dehydrogenase subunit G